MQVAPDLQGGRQGGGRQQSEWPQPTSRALLPGSPYRLKAGLPHQHSNTLTSSMKKLYNCSRVPSMPALLARVRMFSKMGTRSLDCIRLGTWGGKRVQGKMGTRSLDCIRLGTWGGGVKKIADVLHE